MAEPEPDPEPEAEEPASEIQSESVLEEATPEDAEKSSPVPADIAQTVQKT